MSNLLLMTPKQFCEATDACSAVRRFALTQPTMADVWDNCSRADWLLWIAEKLNQRPDDRTLRLFAVWCARNTPLLDGRKTGDLLTDPRSLAALKIAEWFANGNATLDELAAARDNAWAARDAARAASWVAARAAESAVTWAARDAARASWVAARAAESAAAWAAQDAARAARAAAEAAAEAATRAAAEAATRAAAEAAQAAHFRTLMPNPFRKEAQP